MKDLSGKISRRGFIKRGVGASVAGFGIATYVSSAVSGAEAASNRINIGCIGVGRMGLGDIYDVRGIEGVRIVGVCDVDMARGRYAQGVVNDFYGGTGCGVYSDYRELLGDGDIDAVQICTPDHWHAMNAIAAVKAGKDVFLQKPLTYTVREGRELCEAVERYGAVLQVGSQQRSDAKFRQACELVRNGRVGKLHTIKIGMGTDVAGGAAGGMAVPENLDYEMWLGPAPWAPYAEERVHPREGYGRPGWLRVSDYCLGMITGWGAHHVDIAHWGMGTEYSGPVEIRGKGSFPTEGLWDVHGAYNIEYKYANGVRVVVADHGVNEEGVRFIGDEGWVHVLRGGIDANPKSLLKSQIRADEEHLYESNDHKRNFVECIRSRGETVAPVEVGHRSCSACILGYIAMVTGQELRWDAVKEEFVNSDVGNRMLGRSERGGWSV